MRTKWYVVADAGDVAEIPVGVTLLGDRLSVEWRRRLAALLAQ